MHFRRFERKSVVADRIELVVRSRAFVGKRKKKISVSRFLVGQKAT